MRAVKDSFGHSHKESYRELEGPRWTRAVGDHLSVPVWPVSLVLPVSHVPRQKDYARRKDSLTAPDASLFGSTNYLSNATRTQRPFQAC